MLSRNDWRSDFINLLRDDMVVLISILPMVMIICFKCGILWGQPLIAHYLSFDIGPYTAYIMAFVILISSELLGVVMGFMMINDRDQSILEWICVTPLGLSGYVANRMVLVSILNVAYVIITIYSFKVVEINLAKLAFITAITSLVTIIIGMMLFVLASDKVKGLTYAKFLNIWSLLVFSDLLKDPLLTGGSMLIPTYWIGRLIHTSVDFKVYLIATLITLIWLVGIGRIFKKKLKRNLLIG